MDKGQSKKDELRNPEALVEEYDALLSYPDRKAPVAIIYESWMIAEVRDRIHKAGLDSLKKVKMLDRLLLKQLLSIGGADIEENKNPEWWWHLNEIAKREYPPDKLPEYLRDLY